jgi:hypothetical protein
LAGYPGLPPDIINGEFSLFFNDFNYDFLYISLHGV